MFQFQQKQELLKKSLEQIVTRITSLQQELDYRNNEKQQIIGQLTLLDQLIIEEGKQSLPMPDLKEK